MKLQLSNRQRKTRIAVIVALVAFGTVFMLTGYLMTQVYGLKPGDVGYFHFEGNGVNPENTPYQDFVSNGCLTAPFTGQEKTIILDTKGLSELGLFWYDPNTCFDLAKNSVGYIIDKVETYGDDQMKITMVKK